MEAYLEAIRKNIEWLKKHNTQGNKEGRLGRLYRWDGEAVFISESEGQMKYVGNKGGSPPESNGSLS